MAQLCGAAARRSAVCAGGGDAGDRSDAAVFHLGHYITAEAGRAQSPELSVRASDHDVLAWPRARRHAPEHFLTWLGEACVQLLLRALERRSDSVHCQSAPLQCARGAGCHHRKQGDNAVRAADGVADVRPGGHGKLENVATRSLFGGEPLNPEIIEHVQNVWGLTVREAYGQTETTVQIACFPGQMVKPGSMGLEAPGYRIRLLDAVELDAEEGEVCIDLDPPPIGLMRGYQNDDGSFAPLGKTAYRTGDVATCDADGYYTYVGRADDVFKASDYRISPFELESALIEHPAVAEAAVVPAPDPIRMAVPKAYITLTASSKADRETALSIFQHLRTTLAPFKRVRRLEFTDLPKTISGKIRRVELRHEEEARARQGRREAAEFREEDFPELRVG